MAGRRPRPTDAPRPEPLEGVRQVAALFHKDVLIRRSILEQIPFPVGYGVETAMLIDIYQRLGLGVLAQTDLDRRIHRNQETIALGRMAFGVLRTFMSRLRQDQKVVLQEVLPSIMRQFEVSDGHYRQVEHMIEEIERQPILEVEAYRQKFHLKDA